MYEYSILHNTAETIMEALALFSELTAGNFTVLANFPERQWQAQISASSTAIQYGFRRRLENFSRNYKNISRASLNAFRVRHLFLQATLDAAPSNAAVEIAFLVKYVILN